jgi:hypothetical protein
VNRTKVGFFSISHHAASGDDRPYLAWHQMDHMPEQYQLPGLLLGQRWASTARCREVRAAAVDDWALVGHVVCYLMGNPVDETLDEFFTLGRHLAELGRMPLSLPPQYRGGLRLLDTVASPGALVSAEVVPFRPHRGVYVLVDEPDRSVDQDAALQRIHTDVLPTLAGVPGVAGAWSYATTPSIRRPMFSDGSLRIIVCYLDEDPATVGGRLSPVVDRLWSTSPSRLVLAAPFESVVALDLDRFGPDSV